MERQILHVDVNNAFLSWTALDMLKNGSEIDIREIPAVIGGDESKRSGIVLAKSMKAKECGVKTAETIYQARMKCPGLKAFPSNFKIYSVMLRFLSKATTPVLHISMMPSGFTTSIKASILLGSPVTSTHSVFGL